MARPLQSRPGHHSLALPGTIPVRYRGWTMAFVAFMTLALTIGPSSATMPLFYGAIVADTGWSLTDTTLFYTCKNFAASAATLLLAGPVIVRYGLRRVMVAAFALTAAGMASFLAVDSRPTFYAAAVVQGVGLAVVIVGANMLISRWFHRNHGVAVGVSLAGMSAGSALFPLLAAPLIAGVGWRAAMAVLSLFVVAVALPLYLWKSREEPTPEETEAETGSQALELPPRPESGVAPAANAGAMALLRAAGFWRIVSALLLIAIADVAIVQHTPLILAAEAGIGDDLAALALSVMFATAVAGKIVAGRLYDRLSIRGMCLWDLLVAASIVLVLPVVGPLTLLVFASVRGIAHGGLLPKPAVLAKHCYRAGHVEIGLPLFLGVWMIGAAVGPVVLAFVFDATGHYRYGLALLVALSLVAAWLLRGVRPAPR